MRVLVCALLRALVLPAAASATVDGSDYNRPFDTADVSDCVYTKSRSGISAFAIDGSYLPFGRVARLRACARLDAGAEAADADRRRPDHLHVPRRGGQAARAPGGERPQARTGAAAVRRPQRQRLQRAELHLPDLRTPDRAARMGAGGIIMATLKSRQPALRLDLVVQPGGG